MGGTALPDLQEYYMAAQLSHMYYFNKAEMQRYGVLVCGDTRNSMISPLQAIFRGGQTPKRRPWYNMGIANTPSKNLGNNFKKAQIWACTLSFPLWFNNHLLEFRNVPDPNIWAKHRIIYLHQVMTNERPKSFQTLKEEYSIPQHMVFIYLQLCHALRAQFRDNATTLEHPQVLDVIMGPEPQKLISNLYYTIRLPRITTVIQKAKIEWEKDVGDISNTDWDEILENVKTSPKLSDRLTQLYIVHQAYMTPKRLARFQSSQSPTCSYCTDGPSTFYHLIWECPTLQIYWTQVIKFLHDKMGSPVVLDPKLCILGLLPDTDIDKFHATFIHKTLFMARKVIARVWMQSTAPALSIWKRDINNTLPYKKLIYTHRGCTQKYLKIWDRWFEDGETCS